MTITRVPSIVVVRRQCSSTTWDYWPTTTATKLARLLGSKFLLHLCQCLQHTTSDLLLLLLNWLNSCTKLTKLLHEKLRQMKTRWNLNFSFLQHTTSTDLLLLLLNWLNYCTKLTKLLYEKLLQADLLLLLLNWLDYFFSSHLHSGCMQSI